MSDTLNITLTEATAANGERLTTISGAGGGYNGSFLTEAEYGRTHGSLVDLQSKNPSLYLEVRDHLNARVSDPDAVSDLRSKLVASGHADVTLDISSGQVLRDAADPYGGVRTSHQPNIMLETSPIPLEDGTSRSYRVTPDILEDSKFLDKFLKKIPIIGGIVVGSMTMASGANASEIAVETVQATVPGADTGFHGGQAVAALYSAATSSGSAQDRHLDNFRDSLSAITFGLFDAPDGDSEDDIEMVMDILKMGIDDMTKAQRLGFSEDELLSTKVGREYIASILPHEAQNIEAYGAYHDELLDRAADNFMNTEKFAVSRLEEKIENALSSLNDGQVTAQPVTSDFSPS